MKTFQIADLVAKVESSWPTSRHLALSGDLASIELIESIADFPNQLLESSDRLLIGRAAEKDAVAL